VGTHTTLQPGEHQGPQRPLMQGHWGLSEGSPCAPEQSNIAGAGNSDTTCNFTFRSQFTLKGPRQDEQHISSKASAMGSSTG
jgi:hypothetical protein